MVDVCILIHGYPNVLFVTNVLDTDVVVEPSPFEGEITPVIVKTRVVARRPYVSVAKKKENSRIVK